jgi:hypothetical protein
MIEDNAFVRSHFFSLAQKETHMDASTQTLHIDEAPAIELERLRLERARIDLRCAELAAAIASPAAPAPESTPPSVQLDTAAHAPRGDRVQRYTSDGKRLLETYAGITSAARDGKLDNPVPAMINGAIEKRKLYKGFRWARLDRSLPPTTVQDIGETVAARAHRSGLVAVLDQKATAITAVYSDSKATAEALNLRGTSPISHARNNHGYAHGHRVMMWYDCPQDLKDAYLASIGGRANLPAPRVRGRGKPVERVDLDTKEVQRTYSSIAHVLTEMEMARKTLWDAIESGEPLRGSVWRYATKRG